MDRQGADDQRHLVDLPAWVGPPKQDDGRRSGFAQSQESAEVGSADTITRDSSAARSKTASSVAAFIVSSSTCTASCPAARSPAATRGDSALSMRKFTRRGESCARGPRQQRTAGPRCICSLQGRMFLQDLVDRHAVGDHADHGGDRHPETANAGNTPIGLGSTVIRVNRINLTSRRKDRSVPGTLALQWRSPQAGDRAGFPR